MPVKTFLHPLTNVQTPIDGEVVTVPLKRLIIVGTADMIDTLVGQPVVTEDIVGPLCSVVSNAIEYPLSIDEIKGNPLYSYTETLTPEEVATEATKAAEEAEDLRLDNLFDELHSLDPFVFPVDREEGRSNREQINDSMDAAGAAQPHAFGAMTSSDIFGWKLWYGRTFLLYQEKKKDPTNVVAWEARPTTAPALAGALVGAVAVPIEAAKSR